MARRPEPNHKTPEDQLADLFTGHKEAAFTGPADAQRYVEKVLAAQGSLPNAVKFFAYDLLAEASHQAGDFARCLDAVAACQKYLPIAQEEAPRGALKAYMPELRFCERGISALSDQGDIAAAVALCDVAIELGLGKAYESKRRSLERQL